MQLTPEEREYTKISKHALKDLFQVLFGTKYIDQYFAMLMVGLSIALATLIPHHGLFATSQSPGMTNYHRWLYDIFVVVSSSIGFVFYFWLKRQKSNIKVGQKWRAYIKANSDFKMYRYCIAQLKGKEPFMHTPFKEYCFILLFLALFILMYSLLTPFENGRRGNFWIQTWWPVNAFIIGVLYSGLFWIYFRLFAIKAIMNQYALLIRQERANNKHNKAIEKCQ